MSKNEGHNVPKWCQTGHTVTHDLNNVAIEHDYVLSGNKIICSTIHVRNTLKILVTCQWGSYTLPKI